MNEDLARSERPTARGGRLRPRSRLAPGPLRPAPLRQGPLHRGGLHRGGLRGASPGIARGVITGALLGVGVLAAFTLPFLREGGAPPPPAAPAASRSPVQSPVALPPRQALDAAPADRERIAAPRP